MRLKSKFIISFLISIQSLSSYAGAENTYTLQQSVDYALQNNPGYQMMQDRIIQAEAALGQALASFYPHIKTRLSYTHSTNPAQAFAMIIAQRRLSFTGTDFNNPGGVDNYRPEVTASYSLFRGGQDYFMSKSARLGIEVATLEQAAMRNRLIETVHSTFYGYLAAIEAHKVAQRTITAVKSELHQSRLRYQEGTALKSDVLSLEVQLAEAKDAEIRAANGIELARTGLKTILGMEVDQAFDVNASENWTMPIEQGGFTSFLEQAFAQRPEIKAVNKRLNMVKNQLIAAKGAHLPTANAFVSYGSDSKDLDFSSNRDNVTAGVVVELDIFSGFQTSEKVRKLQRQMAIVEKTVKQMRLQIENEVKTAHLRLTEALARMQVTTASVKSAEEALRMVKEQRKAGAVTVTRYIEAEVARDKAYSRQIAARYDTLRAKAQLDMAMGLWR